MLSLEVSTNEKLSQIKDTQIEKVSSEISNKENAKPENSQQKIDISKERISTSKESIDTSKEMYITHIYCHKLHNIKKVID
jgi:hypothetical protein